MTPEDFARSYATLFTRFWTGRGWEPRRSPILNYLQHKLGPQSVNAQALKTRLRAVLPRKTKQHNVNIVKTFRFNGYDYINNSIERTFLGKATPWEIQETLQLMTEVGVVDDSNLLTLCASSLGVDCGGFVAAYWGEACPHMVQPAPPGWDGMLPRTFWASTALFPDVMKRRRGSLVSVKQGDAAIFFSDVLKDDPDIAKKKDAKGNFIEGTGSQAFHIGLVQAVGKSSLTICESSGEPKGMGGTGVGVRDAPFIKSGVSLGKWVYCQMTPTQRIYFVAPPWGWGPEEAYRIGEA